MNRMLRMLSGTVILSAACAVGAWAMPPNGIPTPGTYNSTDLGGAVLLGRGTQSWAAPLNANHGVGDVFNSQSWDGANLGTQWSFQCGVQAGPQSVEDNRDMTGTGNVVYTNVFNGGSFFLSGDGPWANGSSSTGTIQVTQSIVTVIYVDGTPVQSRLNIDSSGYFDGTSCVLRFVVANGIGGGDTDQLAKPADYPVFLDPNCGATRQYGSWGDIGQITLLIECPVPVHESTWGRIKTMYH